MGRPQAAQTVSQRTQTRWRLRLRVSSDFPAIPSLNQALVMELARCEYIQRRDNVIAIGNSGAGKTHMALGLGLAACQRGLSVGFHHRRRLGPMNSWRPGTKDGC